MIVGANPSYGLIAGQGMPKILEGREQSLSGVHTSAKR